YTQMGVYWDAPASASPRVLVEIDVSFVTLWRRAGFVRGWRRLPALVRAGLALDAELFLARRVARVFAMSREDARLLRRFLPRLPVSVVPNGVDTEAHPYRAQHPEAPVLLFVGYSRHPPNVEAVLDFAARTFPRIRAALPRTRWLIAGAAPPPAVQALAVPGSGITVLGYVEDLEACYASSTVFVAPVTRGSGTRLKILEAMARGVPVVTTSVGA